VPKSDSHAYRERKHYTNQNVRVVVDFDMKFIYVLTGWEGLTHDAMILIDILDILDGLKILDCMLYLVDAGYAFHPRIISPFRSTRYHLDEFSTYKVLPQKFQGTFQSYKLNP
jgi:hypothetical protein